MTGVAMVNLRAQPGLQVSFCHQILFLAKKKNLGVLPILNIGVFCFCL